MPMVGLKCGKCLKDVDVDHFGPQKCLHVPRAMAEQVLVDQRDRPEGWTVTMVQGSIREHIIKKTQPYRIDPVKHMSMQLGTSQHAMLGWHDYPVIGKSHRYHGTISGLKLSGEPDLWEGGDDVADYKFTGSLFRMKGPKYEHRVQVSLYAELIEQQTGVRPTNGVLYYGGFGQSMKNFRFDIIPLEECLDSKVDRVRTLLDNIILAREYEEGRLKLDDIPCGCKEVFFGKASKADNYCDVSLQCRELEGSVF